MKQIIILLLTFFTIYNLYGKDDRYLTCYTPKKMYQVDKYLLNCEVKNKDADYVVRLDMKFKDFKQANRYAYRLYKQAIIVVLINPWRIRGNILGAQDIMIVGERLKENLKKKGYIK